jgi:tRNA-specific 2-thiouridylase
MFPLGDYRKEEIRQMARQLGLRVAAKRDSQEICFVPDQDHARFILGRRGQTDTSGEIVTAAGTVVGHHAGYERYTIGQRKGLRLALGEPRYVVRIEAESHRVVIGAREELARSDLAAGGANWLAERSLQQIFSADVKIRYRSRPAGATVRLLAGDEFHVAFDAPQYGIAPGQAAVCYDGERVLGGGWIR